MAAGTAAAGAERVVRAPDGARLAVRVRGSARAPITVLLAHGWTLDARCWEPVAELLAAGPHPPRVVSYDHRGHGRSDAVDPATMTIDQLADDLAAVVAATAPDGPLVLVGHSMGGMALMALAQRHPEIAARAAGLALVATAAGGLGPGRSGPGRAGDASLRLPAAAARLAQRLEQRTYGSARWAARETMGESAALGAGLRWLLLGTRPDARSRRLTLRAVADCRRATVAGFRPTLDAHEREAALTAYAGTPTSVLVGTRDRLTPPSAARRIVAALPSARLTVFPGAGHMLPVERVTGVTGRIAALVRGAEQER